jgi:hypothetical protein
MSAIEVHNPEGGDLFRIADVFAKSGMFPEARDAAQCAAKLIVGQGLGLTPYDSMNGLHIIQGKGGPRREHDGGGDQAEREVRLPSRDR